MPNWRDLYGARFVRPSDAFAIAISFVAILGCAYRTGTAMEPWDPDTMRIAILAGFVNLFFVVYRVAIVWNRVTRLLDLRDRDLANARKLFKRVSAQNAADT